MPDIDNTPKTVWVLTPDGVFEEVVTECGETDWKRCIACRLFGSCQFKNRNRTGVIPNLVDDFKNLKESLKKRKIKFFMELKNFNKSHEKNL